MVVVVAGEGIGLSGGTYSVAGLWFCFTHTHSQTPLGNNRAGTETWRHWHIQHIVLFSLFKCWVIYWMIHSTVSYIQQNRITYVSKPQKSYLLPLTFSAEVATAWHQQQGEVPNSYTTFGTIWTFHFCHWWSHYHNHSSHCIFIYHSQDKYFHHFPPLKFFDQA